MQKDSSAVLASVRSPLVRRRREAGHGKTDGRALLNQTVHGACETAVIVPELIDEFYCVGEWAHRVAATEFGADRSTFCSSPLTALQAAMKSIDDDHMRIVAVVGLAGWETAGDQPGSGVAEHVMRTRAKLWQISHANQFAYAMESFERALECSRVGDFRSEIVPVELPTHDGRSQRVSSDELRCGRGTSTTPLQGRSTAEYVTVTAPSDAESDLSTAAMVTVLTTPRRANIEGRAVRGYIRVAENLSSTAPILVTHETIAALEATLRANSVTMDGLDHVEVLEDCAVTPLIWRNYLRLDRDLLNPRGGALALGSCGQAEGLRAVSTALAALGDTGGRFGLVVCRTDEGTGVIVVEKTSARTCSDVARFRRDGEAHQMAAGSR